MTHSPDLPALWRAGEPVAALARAAGVHPATLRRRARREGWGARGAVSSSGAPRSSQAPPADPAPVLLLRLASALSAAADSLEAGESGESGSSLSAAELRSLTDLIRAHRRAALAALESARRLTPPPAASGAAAHGSFDLSAARREVLGRLARLSAAQGAAGFSGGPPP